MNTLAHIDTKRRHPDSQPIVGVAGIFAIILLFAASLLVTDASLAASGAGNAGDKLVAFEFRIAGDEVRTRVVIEFEQKPDFSYHLLASPHRLVIDLPETVFGFQDSLAKARGLLTDVRYGAMAPGRSRIVFTSVGPVKVVMADAMESESDGTFRLVVDLAATSDNEFASLVGQQQWDPASPEKETDIQSGTVDAGSGFTVAIDPGHGGIDTGAKGRGGADEKDITLAMVLALKTALERDTDMNVVLTRDSDSFVSLSERVRRARQQSADMFVSIHADSIRVRGVRGATVYTLSEKASDQMAQQLAAQENRSDLIAGLSLEDEPDTVADILIDLTRRETRVFSDSLAAAVIGAFDGTVKLINNPHRSAGFRVLRAPEVPSVLVELGYLSNEDDEKLLTDPKWRNKTADLLALAISAYRDKVTGVSN
ncbi:MAG: N-acetylmuramoyl-L-alanine amidase [Hyphomicrobiales bacterium]|nr:N-acetylmuramoyl-L-alanine amidase [Hyphomicrobiales bacterium]